MSNAKERDGERREEERRKVGKEIRGEEGKKEKREQGRKNFETLRMKWVVFVPTKSS